MSNYYVSSGVTSSGMSLNENDNMFVLSGGTAVGTTVNTNGNLIVSEGGGIVKTTVNAMGAVDVAGGTATDTTVKDQGWLWVSSEGIAERTVVSSNGTAEAQVNGVFFDTAVYGTLRIGFGGVAVNTESYGGAVLVAEGGLLTGSMFFDSSSYVILEANALLDFDISRRKPADSPVLNDMNIFLIPEDDFSLISYYLTVSGGQKNGTYRLAEGATGFNGELYVIDTAGTRYDFISVGHPKTINGVTYRLILAGGTLCLTVEGSLEAPEFLTGCFAGGIQSMLAKQSGNTVTVYREGSTWGAGLTLDPGWGVVGTGDFNADGRDDFLRVNGDGYVVGEMANANGTFSPTVLNLKTAGWEILGTGDFDGNGKCDVLVANPTGASSTVGLLGYWEGGTTWKLINGYSAEWECVSTGDFNGDGKCDMLWRNSFVGAGGLTYNAYCTWIVDNPVDWRMVSVSNLDEWDFLCSGDFDGNGSHDIAMINSQGVVGIWGVSDGYLSSWSILSAVNTADWTLAGVGDFNADGTDDIAWCSDSTGLAGYWQINNKTLTVWVNIAVVS